MKAKKLCHVVLQRISLKYLLLIKEANTHAEKYGIRQRLLYESRVLYPWITLNSLKYTINKTREKVDK